MQNRIALVTGGSRGIGRSVAIKLAEQGAQVIFLYGANESAAKQTLDEIKALGVQAAAIQCDVSSLSHVQDVMNEVKKSFGPIDILVNNAGITLDGMTHRMTSEAFDRVISVNLTGTFNTIRAAYGDFLRKRWGRIVNISSVSGLMGNPGQANYAAAKAGVIGLTKTIARELASRGTTCNAVCPGFIQTDMTGKMDEITLEKAVQAIPMRHLGQCKDISEAVSFLCGDGAAYITGAVLKIDGGLYM